MPSLHNHDIVYPLIPTNRPPARFAANLSLHEEILLQNAHAKAFPKSSTNGDRVRRTCCSLLTHTFDAATAA